MPSLGLGCEVGRRGPSHFFGNTIRMGQCEGDTGSTNAVSAILSPPLLSENEVSLAWLCGSTGRSGATLWEPGFVGPRSPGIVAAGGASDRRRGRFLGRKGRGVCRFCRGVIDVVSPLVPAVKPQAAFF